MIHCVQKYTLCVTLQYYTRCEKLHLCVKLYLCVKLHLCVKLYLSVKLHLCVKLHTVQYKSSFFHISIGKFYTLLHFFTQPAVVMVVTNMKCDHMMHLYRAKLYRAKLSTDQILIGGCVYNTCQSRSGRHCDWCRLVAHVEGERFFLFFVLHLN